MFRGYDNGDISLALICLSASLYCGYTMFNFVRRTMCSLLTYCHDVHNTFTSINSNMSNMVSRLDSMCHTVSMLRTPITDMSGTMKQRSSNEYMNHFMSLITLCYTLYNQKRQERERERARERARERECIRQTMYKCQAPPLFTVPRETRQEMPLPLNANEGRTHNPFTALPSERQHVTDMHNHNKAPQVPVFTTLPSEKTHEDMSFGTLRTQQPSVFGKRRRNVTFGGKSHMPLNEDTNVPHVSETPPTFLTLPSGQKINFENTNMSHVSEKVTPDTDTTLTTELNAEDESNAHNVIY